MTIRQYHNGVLIISTLFIFLFAYTALSKLSSIDSFLLSLSLSPVVRQCPSIVAWSIILSEILAVLLLIYPPFRLVGLILSGLLMLAFTSYVGIMLLSGVRLPCSCGGIIGKLSWRQHFYLNVGLTILATLGSAWEWQKKRPRPEFEQI